jgi:hypothetical protein
MGSVRISIAIFSYCGRLFFGITGDYDTVTDIDVLRDGIEEGMHELVVASGGGSAEEHRHQRSKRTPARSRSRAISLDGQAAALRPGKR